MPRLVPGVWSGGVGLRLPDKEFWGPRRYFMVRLLPRVRWVVVDWALGWFQFSRMVGLPI